MTYSLLNKPYDSEFNYKKSDVLKMLLASQ